MRLSLKRALAGLAGLAVAASLSPLMASPAAAAPPAGPSDQGTASVRTAGGGAALASGDSATNWTLRLPSGASCAGDNSEGFRVQGFLVSQAVDLSTLAFNSFGPTPYTVGSATNTRVPLFDTTGTPYFAFPAPAASPGGPGAVINIPDFNYTQQAPGDIPAGVYKLGLACVNGGAIQEYWDTLVTVSTPGGGPAQFNWAQGAVAAAPVLDSVTAGNGTLTANFTPGVSDPAATSFTATASGPGGPFTATGGSSPLTITGLANGSSYSVTVTATNTVGTSAPSNAISGTPQAGPRTNVTGVSVTPGAPGSGNATVNWTAPGANTPPATPTGYQVVVTGPTASTQTVAHPGTSLALTGLAAGSYSVTVTAQYATAPTTGTVPASTPVAFNINPAQVLLQDIDVNRPVGALVLTQVCGAHGALPQVNAGTFTGFPDTLLAEFAVDSSTVVAPTTGGTAPTVTGGGGDPFRGEYPYPTDENTGVANPNYPTHCGVDLGVARFVTRGAGAGQFFAARGILNQVTVVDTRDDDAGWTITGQMSDFVANGTDTFSGSQLGWVPRMTEDTPAFQDATGASYNQTVAAGSPVAPNTQGGLGNGEPLATALANQGLGTAILDARLLLLIPVTADAGDYTGVLTLTATGP